MVCSSRQRRGASPNAPAHPTISTKLTDPRAILAPMSDANVDLARKAFEAFAARDVDAALAVMDEDVEFLPVTANLTTGGVPYRGHEGMRSYLEDVARVWDELRVYPSEYRDLGETVVVVGRIH